MAQNYLFKALIGRTPSIGKECNKKKLKSLHKNREMFDKNFHQNFDRLLFKTKRIIQTMGGFDEFEQEHKI